MRRLIFSALLILTAGYTAGCTALQGPSDDPAPTQVPVETAPAGPTSPGPDTETAYPTPLPPDPITISFPAADGFELNGLYYPSSRYPAPVLVLMHWFPGDQEDWREIAFWLQNRGLSGPGGEVPWQEPSWFPELPGNQSYAVFTFTFRGCRGGCQAPEREKWQLDARAGIEQAARLPGVDPEQIAAAGASIGADGAIIGCAGALESGEEICRGAFTLSPGNYLDNSYQDDLAALQDAQPAGRVRCLYDENDHTADLCKDLSGPHFQAQRYSGGYLHGMHMVNPDLTPNPLELLLGFLGEIFPE